MGVEGGIEVDEVYGFVANIIAQDLQVVSVEQGVAAGGRRCHGGDPVVLLPGCDGIIVARMTRGSTPHPPPTSPYKAAPKSQKPRFRGRLSPPPKSVLPFGGRLEGGEGVRLIPPRGGRVLFAWLFAR